MRKILITGGAGFIGSALVRYIINETSDAVVVVDKLTYAGNLMSLAPVAQSERFAFEKVDICDRAELARVFTEYQPDCVMHLAAESHVDRSIDGPAAFIETNIVGTYTLLEAARAYWTALTEDKKSAFRFHHISTDEVYGDLHSTDDFFTETTPYAPSSPYSASKASSDHLVRAWLRTYGLPTLITNCSNNYGPYHFPEKLIPLMILNALAGKPLPYMATGSKSVTGCMLKIMPARCIAWRPPGKSVKPIILAVTTSVRISRLWKPSASCWKNWLRTSRTAWRTIAI